MITHYYSRTYACMNAWCPNYRYEIDIFPEKIGPYYAYNQRFFCPCVPQAELPIIRVVEAGEEKRIYDGS